MTGPQNLKLSHVTLTTPNHQWFSVTRSGTVKQQKADNTTTRSRQHAGRNILPPR